LDVPDDEHHHADLAPDARFRLVKHRVSIVTA
jgi:hypothetical protein